MKIEICAYSVESCINAEVGGAKRIELCGGVGEGGTTPSAGLLEMVKEVVSIPVYVMIRPRGGDFVYDTFEEQVMRKDIDIAKKYGADGIVLGVLLPDGRVDVARTKALVDYAAPLKVTFHRAFDLTPDPLQALEDVIATGAERILTSGLKANALAGIETLRVISAAAGNRIEIMAGAGVNPENALQLKEAGVHALHFTAKVFRPARQTYFPDEVTMALEVPDERSVMYSDLNRVEQIVKAIS